MKKDGCKIGHRGLELSHLETEHGFDLTIEFYYLDDDGVNCAMPVQPYPGRPAEGMLTRQEWRDLARLVESHYAKYSDEEIEESINAAQNILQESREQEHQRFLESRARKDRSGYVYFVLRTEDMPVYEKGEAVRVKIGMTTVPEKRIYNLSRFDECIFVRLESVDDRHRVERDLHTHFDTKRIKGEVFMITKSDVNEVVIDDLFSRGVDVWGFSRGGKVVHRFQYQKDGYYRFISFCGLAKTGDIPYAEGRDSPKRCRRCMLLTGGDDEGR